MRFAANAEGHRAFQARGDAGDFTPLFCVAFVFTHPPVPSPFAFAVHNTMRLRCTGFVLVRARLADSSWYAASPAPPLFFWRVRFRGLSDRRQHPSSLPTCGFGFTTPFAPYRVLPGSCSRRTVRLVEQTYNTITEPNSLISICFDNALAYLSGLA